MTAANNNGKKDGALLTSLGVELKMHIIKLLYPLESFRINIRNGRLHAAMHLIVTRYFSKSLDQT